MPDTPAAELREAAEKLRRLATATHAKTWGVARTRDTHPEGDGALETIGVGVEPTGGPHDFEIIFRDPDISAEDAEYIAVMDPSVSLTLAKLLERQSRAAAEVEQFLGDEFQDGALDQNVHDALAVARRILGTENAS